MANPGMLDRAKIHVVDGMIAAGLPEQILHRMLHDPMLMSEAVLALQSLNRWVEEVEVIETRLASPDAGLSISTVFAGDTKIFNLLNERGINSLGQLCMWNAYRLKSIRNVGESTVRRIEDVLRTHGLSFAPDEPGMFIDGAFYQPIRLDQLESVRVSYAIQLEYPLLAVINRYDPNLTIGEVQIDGEEVLAEHLGETYARRIFKWIETNVR